MSDLVLPPQNPITISDKHCRRARLKRSPVLISVAEIAVRLGVSKARIYRLLSAGIIPAIQERQGGHWIIRRAAFEAWLGEGDSLCDFCGQPGARLPNGGVICSACRMAFEIANSAN